jgi:hypothetical protein
LAAAAAWPHLLHVQATRPSTIHLPHSIQAGRRAGGRASEQAGRLTGMRVAPTATGALMFASSVSGVELLCRFPLQRPHTVGKQVGCVSGWGGGGC